MDWEDKLHPAVSVYVAVPFCQARCTYCDFNTYAGLDHLIPAYIQALVREIEWVGQQAPEPVAVRTLYFGGGTPSRLSLPQVETVLAALRARFTFTPECEITLEANPGTVDAAKLAGLRAMGVNRLSLGVQSAHADELARLGRIHTFAEAAASLRWARAAGFDNVSVDLIFGLPGQTLERWRATLAQILALQPDHISCYDLTLEENTPLQQQVAQGRLPAPELDTAADMYTETMATLEAHGLAQYEISNWARVGPPARVCEHNLTYWRGEPYLGLGAGAHGYWSGWRYANRLTPQTYMESLAAGGTAPFPFSPACAERTALTRTEAMNEMLMLGLRLVTEGVTAAGFQRRFKADLAETFGARLEKLKALEIVEWDGRRARLTRRGRLLGNVAFCEFV